MAGYTLRHPIEFPIKALPLRPSRTLTESGADFGIGFQAIENKQPSEPQCAAFYLALSIGTAPTTSVTVAQKSYFVSNGVCNETAVGWHHENHVSARNEKRFGLVIDVVRTEPVLTERHSRGVVGVAAVEEYEGLSRAIWADGQAETRKRGRPKITILRDKLASLADVPA